MNKAWYKNAVTAGIVTTSFGWYQKCVRSERKVVPETGTTERKLFHVAVLESEWLDRLPEPIHSAVLAAALRSDERCDD